MSGELIFIVYLFNIFVSLFVGVLLLAVKTAPQLKKQIYHRAKIFLAVATLLSGVGNSLVLLFGMENETVDFFSLVSMVVAAFQACLFTFLVLILFHSPYVSLRHMLKHLTPTLVFILVYLVVVFFRADVQVYSIPDFLNHIGNPALALRAGFALVYVGQLVVYTRLFLRERRIYMAKINDYFSDVSDLKLQLGTRLFFQALGVGVAVILFCFYPGQLQDFILTLLITLFYFGFAVSYINYQYTMQLVMPAAGAVNGRAHTQNLQTSPDDLLSNLNQLKEQLEALLVREPFYLKQGIVIEEVAGRLNVSKRMLSACINTCFGQNFNSWINSLRIAYAKRLIESHPELYLQEVAEQSGFADNAMMSREFKRLTGESPSAYRNNGKIKGSNA